MIFKSVFGKLLLFVISFIILFCTSLYAQSAVERATSEVDRLGQEDVEKLLRKPDLDKKAPPAVIEKEAPPEGETKFFIKNIELLGCESFSPASFKYLTDHYSNREVTLTELNHLAERLEKEYLRRGLVAAAYIPPQDIVNETVKVQVVEARMGKLEIQPHKFFVNSRLRYYWSTNPGEKLKYSKISKSLQVMSRNPDREVKSILRAGEKADTTDVVLTAETKFPIHVFYTFDNDGVVTSGKDRFNFGIRDNNLLGLDDILLAGYTYGTHFRGKYFYHSVPITPKSTFLTYGYSDSHSVPKKDFSAFGISSDAETATFSLHQEFYNTEAYVGEVFVGFDAKDKVIHVPAGLLNKDRQRIFNLGGNYIYRGNNSVTSFTTQFYRGLSGFGASAKDNPFSSRGGQVRPIFSRLNFELSHARLLPWNLRLNLKYRTQYAFDPLAPQEEFNLGGMDSVRGYPPSDFLADNSRVANLEVLIPAFFIPASWKIPYLKDNLRKETNIVTFFDYGHGDRLGTMFNNEKRKVDYMGVGAGVRFSFTDQTSVRLEWAYQLGEKSLTESGKSRFHLAVNFQI